MYKQFRLIQDFALIGQHISVARDSNGYWHGAGWVVQGLTDDGPASEWHILAAFTNKKMAQVFYQSDLLATFGNHIIAC